MDRRSLLLGRRPAPPAAVALAATTPAYDPDPDKRPPPAALPYAGGLAPFTPSAAEPWDDRRARHLLRRATFSATPAQVATALARTPVQAADALVDDALRAGLPPAPSYAALFPPAGTPTPEQTQAYNSANSAGFTDAYKSAMAELLELRAPGTALNERMMLVWHALVPVNRSAISLASRLHEYVTVLRRNALGSFETMIREVGTTQAMLAYLNGSANRVGSPNENYARELLELFTLGVTGPDGAPNYTQADVSALARCLTGWTTPNQQVAAAFVSGRFDAGQKTFLGQTGAFTYDTAHDVLFAQRRGQIATHAARTLYAAFVAATPNEQVVAELATVLTGNGLVVHPAVRALLGSRHFHASMGVRIKNPLELQLGLLRELGWSNPAGLFGTVRNWARDAGLELFTPPDVSGWDEGRVWLDTARVPLRGLATDATVGGRSEARAFAATFPTAANPTAFVADVAARLVALPLAPAVLAEAETLMLGGIPSYEWNPSVASAEGRIRALVQFLARLPEYQFS